MARLPKSYGLLALKLQRRQAADRSAKASEQAGGSAWCDWADGTALKGHYVCVRNEIAALFSEWAYMPRMTPHSAVARHDSAEAISGRKSQNCSARLLPGATPKPHDLKRSHYNPVWNS